jgi:glutamate decarboxylase
MSNLTRVADYLSDSLEALGFIIMSKKSGEGLPLVAFRLPPQEDRHYDEFALAHQLRVRGWVVPAYTMAPHTKNMKMLRVVVREDFTKNRCDALIADIKLSQQLLEQMDRESIKQQQEFIHKHHTASGKSTHNHPKYRVRSSPSVIVFFLRPLSLGRKELQYADRMFVMLQKEKHSLQGKTGKTHAVC